MIVNKTQNKHKAGCKGMWKMFKIEKLTAL